MRNDALGTRALALAAVAGITLLTLAPERSAAAPARLAPQEGGRGQQAGCTVNLDLAGQMSDVLSNALRHGVGVEESRVKAFLKGADQRWPDGESLLAGAAKHFEVEHALLVREVERFRHCNCTHPGGDLAPKAPLGPFELTDFARDVTTHVVLHELAHALVREFDLPVLGNEETLADAFATHYLTAHMPDRALDVLVARTRSLMIEAGEVSRDEWPVRGEHNSDARRAYQVAALAIAADPEKYAPVADVVRMSDRDRRSARDYGAEIHRSWRRILAPLRMPEGMSSSEARVAIVGDEGMESVLRESGLADELGAVLRRFDWHSQVTLRFQVGDGGAGWSRSKRAITVYREYIDRFVRQGR